MKHMGLGRYGGRVTLVCAFATAILICWTASALADPSISNTRKLDERHKNDLRKEPPAKLVESGTDDGVTTLGTAPRYHIQVTSGFAVTVRNEGDQFAIGHGFDADWGGSAWTFDASYVNQSLQYRYGYLYGNYQGCGWINVDSLNYSGNTGNYHCSSSPTVISPSSFAREVNCLPGQCSNGSFVRVTRCTSFGEYGNVRPWTSTSASEHFRGISNPGLDYSVYWRYVSRDNRWVMAMDDRYNHGYGRWVFIWRECLPATLPSSYTKWYP